MRQTSIEDHIEFEIIYAPEVSDLEMKIREMYMAGMTYASIAKALGVEERVVGSRIRRLRRRGYL